MGLSTAAVGLIAVGLVGTRGGLTGVAATWVATLAVAAVATHVLLSVPDSVGTAAPAGQVPPEAAAQSLPRQRATVSGQGSGAEVSRSEDGTRLSAYAWVSLGILVLAATLWIWGSTRIDLAQMTDLGLSSVLPLRMWVALALLAAAMVLALVDARTPTWVLALHVVVLCALVYGLSSWLYEAPRGAVNFRHAGVVSVLLESGVIDRDIDAYFSWAGFFAGAATISEAAGLSSPLSLARWMPAAVNILALPLVLLLVRSLTNDVRRIWLAMWLFGALNWINQDYFAPQALDYLLYLALLALVVHLFRARSPQQSTDEPRHSRSEKERGARTTRFLRWWHRDSDLPAMAPVDSNRPAAVGVVLVLCAAIVACHQLTPFAALTVVTALVLLHRCRLTLLPVILLTMIVAWDGYVALPFISGHADELFGSIGDLSQLAGANVANRVTGTPDHVVIVRLRLVLTLVVWLLAALGAFLRHRRGESSRTLFAISLAPLLLLPAQPYGGEMLLRVYWFVLPGVVLLAASALIPAQREADATEAPSVARLLGQSLAWAGTSLALAGLVASSFVARHGNERIDYYPPAEVAGVRAMYAMLPAGADIIAGSGSFPWRDQGYVKHKAVLLDRLWVNGQEARTATAVASAMRAAPGGAVLVITSSQQEAADMLGTFPIGALSSFANYVDDSREFERIYTNSDVRVWQACGGEGSTC